MRLERTHLYTAVAVVAFAAFLGVADATFDAFAIRVLDLCAIYVVLALSLNLVNGFTGLFSLGHAGFMAVGAYTCALLTMTPEQKEMNFFLEPIAPWLAHLSLPFVPALVVAGLVAAALGFLVGGAGAAAQGRLPRHRHPGLLGNHPGRPHQHAEHHQRRPRAEGAAPGSRPPPVVWGCAALSVAVHGPPDALQLRPRAEGGAGRRDRGRRHGHRRVPRQGGELHGVELHGRGGRRAARPPAHHHRPEDVHLHADVQHPPRGGAGRHRLHHRLGHRARSA